MGKSKSSARQKAHYDEEKRLRRELQDIARTKGSVASLPFARNMNNPVDIARMASSNVSQTHPDAHDPIPAPDQPDQEET